MRRAVLGATAGAALLAFARPSPRPPAFATSFERALAPFTVLDRTGRPYALPFLGGLLAPRPQLIDIDGDGDVDLFLQEYPDQLWFFENTGTPRSPRYEWRSDRFHDLSIGEWYRFADIDADGDYDLVAEHPFSYVRYYRNTGTRTAPHFAYVDSLRDASGAPIFLDRQNIPAFTDIDCDNRLDFFVGRVEGTLARFEAAAPGSERFAFVQENFENILIVGQVDTTGTLRHGANALAFGDFEGDGDADLFWGDFFERSVLVIENVGATCSTPSLQTEPFPLPWADSTATSGYNTPAPVDIDGDGDLDFVMGVIGGAYNPITTSSNNLYFWERTGRRAFALRSKRFLDGIDVGSDAAPAFGDLDGDGDLDLVVGSKIDPVESQTGLLHYFVNEGTPTAPRFREAGPIPIDDAYGLVPALGDLDGDGDLDMLVGTWNSDIRYYRNDGTARAFRFVRDSTGDVRGDRVTNAHPVLADLDGDGDLDLLFGEANGELNYFRNDGPTGSPRFVPVSERVDDLDVGRRSAPGVADVTGDGLPDLVVGREGPGSVVFVNRGTRTAPRFVEDSTIVMPPLPPTSAPRFVDIDGDGVLDLFAGGVSGGIVFHRGVRR